MCITFFLKLQQQQQQHLEMLKAVFIWWQPERPPECSHHQPVGAFLLFLCHSWAVERVKPFSEQLICICQDWQVLFSHEGTPAKCYI